MINMFQIEEMKNNLKGDNFIVFKIKTVKSYYYFPILLTT